MNRRLFVSYLLSSLPLLTLGEAMAQSERKPGAKAPAKSPAKPPAPAVIVLDPGHGGRDPGAIGVLGTEEKDVTLAIARAIRSHLDGIKSIKVRLTRDSDEFLPLPERVRIAHQHGADLFVSIHADHAPNRSARGLSAYTLSEKASDSFAGALAKRENAVDAIYGVDLRNTDRETAAILMDLARRHSKNAALSAKKRIVSGVSRKVKLLENPNRSANFAVLKSPSVPSLLIETGFLSNRDDEKILREAKSRGRLASAIADQIAAVAIDLQKA